MNKDEILKKIKEVITNSHYVEEDSIEEEDRLREDIGMDSLDKVAFFMDLESKFDIKIPEEDYENIFTIKETITYLETKLQ